MERLVQNFSQYWFADGASGSAAPPPVAPDDETLSPSMKEALDALAERINAARTVA
jgi:hypothetical protein